MFLRFLSIICVILTTSACQSTLTPSGGSQSLQDVNPYELLDRANSSRNLAKQQQFRLQAALAFQAQQQYQLALQTLAVDSPPTPLANNATLADQWYRVRAQALLGLGNFTGAEQSLQALSAWMPEDHLILAPICAGLGNFSCSADAYIQAALALEMDSPSLPSDIHDRIWLSLSRAQTAPAGYTHRYHHGWWLLQQQIRSAGSLTAQQQAWLAWQSQYPSHPARIRPPQALSKLSAYQAPQVGFLLPLSGSFGGAGKAVRDGLIAAYLAELSTDKPRLKFYDTAAQALPILYERALSDGAEVLVGPLLREQVESFARLTTYAQVPRLLLNYLTPPGTPSGLEQQFDQAPLYQFGIAIEDEVSSLANHVLLQGPERLLVVHSQARWSQRAHDAYVRQWSYPVTRASFADIKGLTGAIGEAMQVAASDTRKTELANILGAQLEFLPRARGDIDGIVAFTTQVEGRALTPALRFHFADDLPVYATSQATLGKELDPLVGFEVTEMPLFASPNAQQSAFRQAFNLDEDPFAELFALGYDAYRLATWLPILTPDAQVAMPAASGYLWLEPGGKFRRDLRVSRIGPQGSRTPLD